MKLRAHALLLALVLILAGCTPFSHRTEPKELFPEDSLSRELAETIIPDTLVLNWRRDGGENAYFSSIVFGTDSTLWVGDLGQHAVRRFTMEGKERAPRTGYGFPYLAGRAVDSVVVYDAGSNRLVAVDDTSRTFDLPPTPEKGNALARQVTVLDHVSYVKDSGPPAAVLRRLGGATGDSWTLPLPGPAWHHSGVLRTWLGRVISASSYRPILYVVDPTGVADSVRLQGFDSPMLARIRAYELSKVKELPLVISGLYGTGEFLYVLNVRPGVIQVDKFDRKARIQRILRFEEPKPNEFEPVDLAVRSHGDSTWVFVASVSPIYHAISLTYASHLDRFSFANEPGD